MMSTLATLITTRGFITTEDVEAVLRSHGGYTTRLRDRTLATLCASGEIVRIRRGLYGYVGFGRHTGPDPYLLASFLAPDAVLGLRTALEIRGIVVPNTERCIYFTRFANAGRGPRWRGTTMQAISPPVALVREQRDLVETEMIDGNGCGTMRVATVERAFVDILDRPRLTGDWPEVIQLLGAIAALDFDRMIRYLAYLDNATTVAKAGWFLERHQEQFGVTPGVLYRLERMRPRSPHYLSRTHRVSGRFVARWNLVVPPML
jgi:predicted transcriptional regulator of viral defense system